MVVKQECVVPGDITLFPKLFSGDEKFINNRKFLLLPVKRGGGEQIGNKTKMNIIYFKNLSKNFN